MSETSSLILLVFLLLGSAFFSGCETALVSMTKLAIRRAIERHGDRAKRLFVWERHSDRLLTTILVGNNIMNIAATSTMAIIVNTYIADPKVAVWTNTALMTSVILVLGEILPKQIAKRKPEPISLLVIRPLNLLSLVLRPLVWLFGGIAHAIARLVGAGKGEPAAISRADVEAVVLAAGEDGSLRTEERLLLEEALDFHRTTVKEIMTPRVNMVTVRRDATLDEAKRVIAGTGYSRLPVVGDDENEIVGVLFAKDLLLSHEAERAPVPLVAADLMREHAYIPEMVTISRLMELFRRKQMHLVMVIGEYGDVVGLVTMEDVLERLVGQIEDEYDAVEADVKRLSERRYLVKGTTRLDDLNRALGIELPEGEYETIGGYVISRLGRIPQRGAALRWHEWLIQVYDADERRVQEVSLQFIGAKRGRRRNGGETRGEQPPPRAPL